MDGRKRCAPVWVLPPPFVVAVNAKRRSVSKSMKACAAAKLIPMFGGRWGGKRRGIQDGKHSALNPGESRELAGKMLGVNAHYVSDALRLSKDDPKAFEEVWHDRVGLQSAVSDLSGRKLARDVGGVLVGSGAGVRAPRRHS